MLKALRDRELTGKSNLKGAAAVNGRCYYCRRPVKLVTYLYVNEKRINKVDTEYKCVCDKSIKHPCNICHVEYYSACQESHDYY